MVLVNSTQVRGCFWCSSLFHRATRAPAAVSLTIGTSADWLELTVTGVAISYENRSPTLQGQHGKTGMDGAGV